MTDTIIDPSVIDANNESRLADLNVDYDTLGERLERRGIDIDTVKSKVAAFNVAVPSWGVGTGGTRFARFPASASRATSSTRSRTAPSSPS